MPDPTPDVAGMRERLLALAAFIREYRFGTTPQDADDIESLLAHLDTLTAERDALLRERYWCGCVRFARWTRCERHGELDHDDEPLTRAEEERRAARSATQGGEK